MNGVHDMGGMHGFGPIPDDGAQFHADWERTAYAVNQLLRLQGQYNIHEYRHAVERMPPAEYLGASYFERWFDAVERLLREKDVLTEAEIERRVEAIRSGEYDRDEATLQSGDGAPADADELTERAREAFASGVSPVDAPDAQFEVGDDVVVRNAHPEGHTRVPRYARGATGTVTRIFGTFELPDALAHGDRRAEPVYAVRFPAEELWGTDTDADDVFLDMWESYLDSA